MLLASFLFVPSCVSKQQCLWSYTLLSLAVRFQSLLVLPSSPAVPCCGHCTTSCLGLAHTQVMLLESQPCLESSSDSKIRVFRSSCLFWTGGLSGKMLSCQIPSHTFNFGRKYRIQLLDTWCGTQIPEHKYPTWFEALQEISATSTGLANAAQDLRFSHLAGVLQAGQGTHSIWSDINHSPASTESCPEGGIQLTD